MSLGLSLGLGLGAGGRAVAASPLTAAKSYFQEWIDPTIASTITGTPVSEIKSPASGSFVVRSRYQQSTSASRPAITANRLVLDGTDDYLDGSTGYTFLSAVTPADPAYAQAGKGPTTCGLAKAPDGTWYLSHYGKKHQTTAAGETFNGSLCQYDKNLDGTPNFLSLLREIRFVEELALANVGAQGIAFDAQDANIIWVADAQNGRLYGINITTIAVASNFAFAGANGLAYYPATNRLLVWTTLSNTVTLVNKATGATVSTHTLRDFNNNDGLFFDASYGSSGALYTSGRDNATPGRIIKYDWNAGNPIPIKAWFFDEVQAIESFVVEAGVITICDDEYYHASPAGVNRVVRVAVDTSTTDYGTTLVMAGVAKIAATPAATVALIHGGDGINRKGAGMFFTTTLNQFRLIFRAGSTQATIDWTIASATTEFLWYVLINSLTGDATLYINGVLVSTQNSALITGSIPQLVWTLGASYETSGLPTRFSATTIGGFIVSTDSTHRAEIEGLANWGGGTPVNKGLLPVGHTYELAAPT